MTNQQIQNAIGLCAGEPVSKIMRLFDMGMWRSDAVQAMSDYFGCANDKHAVALCLSVGHKI